MKDDDKWLSQELENLEHKGNNEFVSKLKSNRDKSVLAIRIFFSKLGQEGKETYVASKILMKYMKVGHITKEEEKELRTQLADIFKAVGLGIPFVLIPGSTLLLPLLVKLAEKRGIHLLPTAFNEDKTDNPANQGPITPTDEKPGKIRNKP